MAQKSNNSISSSFSISTIFLTFTLLFSLSLLLLFLSNQNPQSQFSLQYPPIDNLKIYVVDLPRSLNYGLFQTYWSSSTPDARVHSDDDAAIRSTLISTSALPSESTYQAVQR
ncbi:unnamed protein product [Rhodiola kirilowii]